MMIRALRLVVIATAIALTAGIAVAYWWPCVGPFPESAWP